jgi:hypothetical protein
MRSLLLPAPDRNGQDSGAEHLKKIMQPFAKLVAKPYTVTSFMKMD